jgi:streptomycin 6-kinase
MPDTVLRPYLRRWRLEPDGAPFATHGSRLLPVRWQGRPAMLKLALQDEERQGGAVMAWWGGHGAAEVFAHHGPAMVMARAGGQTLGDLALAGQDDAATRIICDVVARLHAPRAAPPPPAVPLAAWFAELEPQARREGGILAEAWATAQGLLAAPADTVMLHGDIHHFNILDFGPRDGRADWRAIDPKGLCGERGYDYANLFRNPHRSVAIAPGRFARRVTMVAAQAGLERERLLRWILAVMGLQASWRPILDAERHRATREIAALARAALD